MGRSRVRGEKKRLIERRRNAYGLRVKKKKKKRGAGSLVLTYKRAVML